MFNLAIDSKLRGCDVVTLKVEDMAPNGYAADRATVRQKKTGRPVKVRADGSDSRSHQRLFEAHKQEGRRIYIHGSKRRRPEHDDPPICSPRFWLDRQPWVGPQALWH